MKVRLLGALLFLATCRRDEDNIRFRNSANAIKKLSLKLGVRL
jgi:hypothetical protein